MVNITFFWNKTRIKYLNKIIAEANLYPVKTDIYIHINRDFDPICIKSYANYTNGKVYVEEHKLKNTDKMKLAYEIRHRIKKVIEDYDIFMSIEDDILVPKETISYWLKYHKPISYENYNLGFLRLEIADDNKEYITDLPGKKFTDTLILDNTKYIINNVNTFCAMWIYNRKIMKEWINHKYWNPEYIPNVKKIDYRGKAAFGLNGIGTWFKDTIIPMDGNKPIEHCKIYHLPNNYVDPENKQSFGTILFNECFQ
tara:strand:+ start:853 stop:1617 length:765 start_codon:yes stop_codon:yes gene_type:complete